MNDDNIRRHIRDEMVEAGIVEESGITLCYFRDGREYIILVTAIDITDWNKETDDE